MNSLSSKKIFACLIFIVLSSCFVGSAVAQGTVVKAESSSNQLHIGDTITVTLKISNVQNLFGIDLTLGWNPNVLSLTKVELNLGVESHSNGVLYGTRLVYNLDNAQSGQIFVEEERNAGNYGLIAQSIGSSTNAFSGSGTIATLTFKVEGVGDAQLSLESELSNKATADQNANLIDHQDIANPINAVIPEFPTLAVIAVLITVATAALVVTSRRLKRTKPTSV